MMNMVSVQLVMPMLGKGMSLIGEMPMHAYPVVKMIRDRAWPSLNLNTMRWHLKC